MKPPASDEAPAIPERCPARDDINRAADLGRSLAATLRRLHRRMKTCRRNPCQPAGCPLQEAFQAQLQTAIGQVLDEWERGAPR